MLAQRRHEVRRYSVPRRPRTARPAGRKKIGAFQKMLGNSMVCILVLAAAVCFMLTLYVGAYAKVTETGCRRGELQSRLRAVRSENEELRATLNALRQPDRVAEFGLAHGMQPAGDNMTYLKLADEPHVAQNLEARNTR